METDYWTAMEIADRTVNDEGPLGYCRWHLKIVESMSR